MVTSRHAPWVRDWIATRLVPSSSKPLWYLVVQLLHTASQWSRRGSLVAVKKGESWGWRRSKEKVDRESTDRVQYFVVLLWCEDASMCLLYLTISSYLGYFRKYAEEMVHKRQSLLCFFVPTLAPSPLMVTKGRRGGLLYNLRFGIQSPGRICAIAAGALLPCISLCMSKSCRDGRMATASVGLYRFAQVLPAVLLA